MPDLAYPTAQHRQAAEQIVGFFSEQEGVDGVILANSCARGKATRDSCLDIIVLVAEHLRDPGYAGTVLEREENQGTNALVRAWDDSPETHRALSALKSVGRFSEIHLDLTDGKITPQTLDRDQGLDVFEIAIGNYFVYSKPLWLRTSRFLELRDSWLPYYGGELKTERLSATRGFCDYFLDHIEPYVERGLYFQAFDRLYHAFQGFLQGLFIAKRTYPIAYNKWIREQVEDILGLADLYRRLPAILEVQALESRELIRNGDRLRELVAAYLLD